MQIFVEIPVCGEQLKTTYPSADVSSDIAINYRKFTSILSRREFTVLKAIFKIVKIETVSFRCTFRCIFRVLVYSLIKFWWKFELNSWSPKIIIEIKEEIALKYMRRKKPTSHMTENTWLLRHIFRHLWHNIGRILGVSRYKMTSFKSPLHLLYAPAQMQQLRLSSTPVSLPVITASRCNLTFSLRERGISLKAATRLSRDAERALTMSMTRLAPGNVGRN